MLVMPDSPSVPLNIHWKGEYTDSSGWDIRMVSLRAKGVKDRIEAFIDKAHASTAAQQLLYRVRSSADGPLSYQRYRSLRFPVSFLTKLRITVKSLSTERRKRSCLCALTTRRFKTHKIENITVCGDSGKLNPNHEYKITIEHLHGQFSATIVMVMKSNFT